jgi:hypothetical protein
MFVIVVTVAQELTLIRMAVRPLQVPALARIARRVRCPKSTDLARHRTPGSDGGDGDSRSLSNDRPELRKRRDRQVDLEEPRIGSSNPSAFMLTARKCAQNLPDVG